MNHINSTPRERLDGRTPYSVALETLGPEVNVSHFLDVAGGIQSSTLFFSGPFPLAAYSGSVHCIFLKPGTTANLLKLDTITHFHAILQPLL